MHLWIRGQCHDKIRLFLVRKITCGFFLVEQPNTDAIRQKLVEFSAQPKPLNTSRTATLDEDTTVLLRNINAEVDGDFLVDFTRLRNIPRLSVSDAAGNESWI